MRIHRRWVLFMLMPAFVACGADEPPPAAVEFPHAYHAEYLAAGTLRPLTLDVGTLARIGPTRLQLARADGKLLGFNVTAQTRPLPGTKGFAAMRAGQRAMQVVSQSEQALEIGPLTDVLHDVPHAVLALDQNDPHWANRTLTLDRGTIETLSERALTLRRADDVRITAALTRNTTIGEPGYKPRGQIHIGDRAEIVRLIPAEVARLRVPTAVHHHPHHVAQ